MITRLSTRYNNLPIRNKLILGFGILIVLLLLVIISNSVIENAISGPANRNLIEASENMLIATRVSSEFGRARYETINFETQVRAMGLDREKMTSLLGIVQQHVDTSIELLDSLDRSNMSSGEIARVEELRSALVDHSANYDAIVSGMMASRGSATTGLGANIYGPLETINASVDATAAMEMVESYVEGFSSDALATLPGALDGLKQAIEDSDLSASQKDALLAEVDASQQALNDLLMLDGRILLRYAEINRNTDTIAEETISAFIAATEQKQRDARARLEDADRIRRIMGWTIPILAVLIALALSRVISRSVSEPIIALNEVARGVAEGNYTQRAAVTTSSEIGQLAQVFNDTISRVSEREAQLHEQTEQLREQTEQLRVASAQAKEAARIKSEFLANMSHELRTPLNAIIGFSDILLLGGSGEVSDKQKHQLERLKANGQRLLTLVNDILDITRIEAKRVELVRQPFSPRTLTQQLASQVEPLVNQKGLDFSISIDPALPDIIVGDQKRIEQIAINLLSNAFKFTETGSVTLECGANLQAKTWHLTVKDTGIGIPPHALDTVFEEFRQVDGSSRRSYGGSGLGLAIVRHLVHIMEGNVTVTSKLHEGSTFIVTLPLVLPGSVTEAVPTSEPLLKSEEA